MKPKIIFLGPIPPPYMGPSIATQIILESQLSQKFRLIHLDTSDHRPLDTLGMYDFWNFYLAFKHYILLIWYIIQYRPKAVYIPLSQTTIGYCRDAIYIYIAKLMCCRVVCHLRGGHIRKWYEQTNWLMKLFIRKTQRVIDAQIVLGKNLVAMFEDIMPVEKIYVVPNGRDFPKEIYQPKHPKNKSAKLQLLFLASFLKTKGVLDLLYALPQIHKEFPNIEMTFAGQWVEQDTKKEFHDFLNKHPNLPVKVITGIHGKEKYLILQKSDLFIFPPNSSEGHPWVTIEASAAGLPIIATDQGAIRESLIEGKNGFFVSSGNPSEISNKVLTLVKDPELLAQMSEYSRNHYLNNLTLACMLNHLNHCFTKVCSKKN